MSATSKFIVDFQTPSNLANNSVAERKARQRVDALCQRFPIYPGMSFRSHVA